MSTMFPEAYADPVMQEMYEDEKGWGLPLPHFDIFMRHSVRGRGQIMSSLGLESYDHPFSWHDKEMFDACSRALLALRNKENLTETQLDQLCWLEMSLMQEISFLDDLEGELGKFAVLVSEQQIEFMKGWEKRVGDEFTDPEGDWCNTIDPTNDIEPSPELTKRTSERVNDTINDFFSAEGEAKRKRTKARVLAYLKNIK